MSSDAATLPSPPDFAPWTSNNRPRSLVGGMYSSGGQQNRFYQNGTNNASPSGGRTPRFPNIKDLQDEAASLDVNEITPVCSLSEPRVLGAGNDC